MNRILALFVCLSLGLGALEARDIIRFLDGREVEVVITKETDTQIQFKDAQTGASQKKSVDEIESVVYEDASRDYQNMLSSLELGDFQRAVGNAAKAKRGMKESKNNWHESYIDYYLAYSLFKLSESNAKYIGKGIAMLKGVATKHAKTRFGVPALYYMGEALILKKDYATAAAMFSKVEGMKGQRPYWAAKASAAQARVLMAQKKYDEALQVCLAQLKEGNLTVDIVLNLTDLLISKKKSYKQAYAIAQKLECKGDRAVRAMVYELKGCAAMHLGQFDVALEDLLRATVLYGSEKNFSNRANVYLFATMKTLISKKPDQYGDWEYQSKLRGCYKKMTVADQKLYKSFKL